METLKKYWSIFINEYCTPSNVGLLSDLIIVAIAIIIVIIAFVLCIKFFIRPGEKEENHIKRLILKDKNSLDKSTFYDRKRI